MNIDINYIPKIFKENVFNYNENSIKFLMYFAIIMALIALVHGSIKENIINSTSIIVMLITGFAVFMVLKKNFKWKIKEMKKNLESCKNPTVMDKLCDNDNWNDSCIIYNKAKKNFNKISNLLVKKYKYIKKFDLKS